MKLRTLALGTALTIATVIGTQSVTHASTRFEFIAKQIGLQINQPRTPQAQTPQAQTPMPSAPSTKQAGGRTFFEHSPRLVRAATSQPGAHIGSTYEFTLSVPANAGQPLKAVTIAQVENLEMVRFDVGRSKAFAGQRFAAGPEIPLASIGGPQPANSNEVTVVFDQPVQPGSTVTIALEAQANPNFGGTYLFGVTAFPEGEEARGLFLGYGRLHFYSSSN